MIQEFKGFLMRGNILDLAVAVIIGAAFGAIIGSLVNDLIMPIVSLLLGGTDFSNLFIALDGSNYATLAEAQEAGAAVLGWGNFIQQIVNFVIIAAALFFILKGAAAAQAPAEPEADPGPTQEDLLGEIRDLLAKR